MHTVPSVGDPFKKYDEAVRGLDGALSQVISGRQILMEDAPTIGDDIEEAAQRYLDASEELTSQIVEGMDGGGADSDALTRMAGIVGVDFAFAEEFAKRVALESEDDSEDPGPTTFLKRSDLLAELRIPEDLQNRTTPLMALVREGDDAIGITDLDETAPPDSERLTIEPSVTKVIEKSADALKSVAGAVTWPEAATIKSLIETAFGEEARKSVEKIVAQLRTWWKRFTKWFVKFVEAALDRIRKLIGSEKLDSLIEKASEWVKNQWDKLIGDDPVEGIFGIALGARDIVNKGDKRLAEIDEKQAITVVETCDTIANSHDNRLGPVRVSASVLKFAGGIGRLVALSGIQILFGITGAALLVYTVWLGHDHVDSEIADFLPDRVKGIRRTVQELP